MKKMKQLIVIGALGTTLLVGGIANGAGAAPLWYTNYLQGKSTPASAVSNSPNDAGEQTTLPTRPADSWPETSNPAGEKSQPGLAEEEQQLLTLLNQSRVARGLQPLISNAGLIELARMKAKDMAEHNYFSHTSPTYGKAVDMVRGAGIDHWIVGENIAITSSASRANTLFMGSSVHRAAMLNRNYTAVGIGMYRSASGSLYVAEIFIGTR